MRALAVTLLALLVAGCGARARDPGFRVDLPDGWEDRTPQYASKLETLNAEAARWARVDIDGVWQADAGRTTMTVGRLLDPPAVSLDTLARRIIRLSRGAILNFELQHGPTSVRVDGAPAVVYDYRGTHDGAVKVRVALIRHGREIRLASMTATPHGFPAGASRMAEVLASWRWI